MSKQAVYIEVVVGELPEWYNEDEHDIALEEAIERAWHKNPAFVSAEIRTSYAYNGAHSVHAYDNDGEKVFARECDLDGAFEFVYQNEVAPYV